MIPGSGRSAGEGIGYSLKNLPAIWETWVPPLGWEDPLEKGTATHSSILAWKIPGLYSPWGHKESDTTEQISFSFSLKLKTESPFLSA